MEKTKILCPQCEKSFRTKTGLAWHLERQHRKVTEDKAKSNGQKSPEAPAKQDSGALLEDSGVLLKEQGLGRHRTFRREIRSDDTKNLVTILATDKQVALLEGRLSKLEEFTAINDTDDVLYKMLHDGKPEPLADRLAWLHKRLTDSDTQLSKIQPDISQLRTQLTDLAGRVLGLDTRLVAVASSLGNYQVTISGQERLRAEAYDREHVSACCHVTLNQDMSEKLRESHIGVFARCPACGHVYAFSFAGLFDKPGYPPSSYWVEPTAEQKAKLSELVEGEGDAGELGKV